MEKLRQAENGFGRIETLLMCMAANKRSHTHF